MVLVLSVSDAFVNSQEWTLSRTVPELKVVSHIQNQLMIGFKSVHPCKRLFCPSIQGIVGNLASGKSALVHRYLTGTYVQEESPEGENIPESLSHPAGCGSSD